MPPAGFPPPPAIPSLSSFCLLPPLLLHGPLHSQSRISTGPAVFRRPDDCSRIPAVAWVRFATSSLALLGYQILSGPCSSCRETPWDDNFRYHPQDGRMLCSACHDSPDIQAESFVTVDRWTLEYLYGIGRDGEKAFLNRPLVERCIAFLDHVLAYRMDGWKSIDSLPVTLS